MEPILVKLPEPSDPLRSTAALVLSSARAVPLWTSRGMLAMAADLAVTARVNLEWEDARKRMPMDVVEVVSWAVRDAEKLIEGDGLPPYSVPSERSALRVALAQLKQVVESYEHDRGGGPAPSHQASEPG